MVIQKQMQQFIYTLPLYNSCSGSCIAILATGAIICSMGSSQELLVPCLKAEQVLPTGPDTANSADQTGSLVQPSMQKAEDAFVQQTGEVANASNLVIIVYVRRLSKRAVMLGSIRQ